MDQPTFKRGFEAISLQNRDESMPNEDEEGGDEAKRFKQELHPLRMETVLEQIFSNLDPDSIKNARQVNKLWSVEGAKMLVTKCYVKIPPAIHDGDFMSRTKALDEFKAFLSHKSSAFSTIPNITVDGVDVTLWKYLGVFEQVKSLKINKTPGKKEADVFRNLLTLPPNLNHLKFEEMRYEPEIIKILTSVMSTPEKDRNSLVISFLSLYIGNMEKLEDIEKFASCQNIMIENLKIEMDPVFLEGVQELVVRVSKLITNILSISQNTLTKLHMVDCHPILPLLEFPCMPELAHMILEFQFSTVELSSCKFSPSFRFSEKVPNLNIICIKEPVLDEPPVNGQISRHCFTNLFERAGIAPSVKRVYCYGNVSDFDIYHIFKQFPNIWEFATNLAWNSHAMLRCLWNHGRNLKKLYVFLDLYPPLETIDDLDASFTGFPVWVVDEIKKAPNLDTFTLDELEKLRVESSILKLEELEKLEIYFRGKWTKNQPKRMLAVAGEHALKYLPENPEIIINIEEFNGSLDLDDVSKLPNVKIVS